MLITALDLETSGLNTDADRVTEIGAVLWDVEQRKPVTFLSYLIKDESGLAPPLSAEVTKITGITDPDLGMFGFPIALALQHLDQFLQQSSAVLVHGVHLDKTMLEQEYAKHRGPIPNLPWVDTQIDFAYPERMKMRALTYLAADHRYLMTFAHRALFDAVTTVQIASHYDIPAAIELARFPIIKVQAGVDIRTKDEAKSRGYYYENSTRSWYKNIRSCLIERERSVCPFTVTEVVPPAPLPPS